MAASPSFWPARSTRPRAVRRSPPPRTAASKSSNRLQRRHHVVDQIVGMLEPARQANHAVTDAEVGALLRLEPLVRRRRRMGDQALGIAEVVGDTHELERILKRERALLAIGDLERYER